jgi:23S rRNA pseudouridine1911/1915/1917 synthase
MDPDKRSRPASSRPNRSATGGAPGRSRPAAKRPAAARPLSAEAATAAGGGVARFIVSRAEDGLPLQDFLSTKLRLSNRRAKDLMDARGVWVNRQCVWMTHHALHAGDVVEARGIVSATPARRPLRVVLETPHYLVVDKPTGLLSVGEDSVEERLRAQLDDPALRAVHRLDRDTTGCLLFARGDAAHAAMVEVFRTRRVRKVYNAIVAGRVVQRVSTVASPIEGEDARSHVTTLASSDDASLVAVRIETGRTHQIRIHMASRRHPVLGDREHGITYTHDPRLRSVPRTMLHAADLSFDNPMARGEIKAHCPMPADFRRCLEIFGLGKKKKR